MSLQRGATLGAYEILGPIGKGGMGEVYEAKDTRLDRRVAIKLLPDSVADNAERKERFEREAKTIAQLNHPNICTLYDVGEQDDVSFLVMELVDGKTLQERLQSGALSRHEALDIARQIASALDVAHRAGVVHRDLKPANVMLTKDGVKLLDFGLAKLLSVDEDEDPELETKQRDLTQDRAILGTLPYMAPEQLEGEKVGAFTDTWALGVVLREMLTGKRTFDANSQAGLIAAILEHELSPLSDTGGSTIVDRVLERCLRKDPTKRWQSASDLGEALGWASQETAAARPSAPASFRLAWIAASAISVALAALLGWNLRDAPEPERQVRFEILPPEGRSMNLFASALGYQTLAVSPDGNDIVFAVVGDEGNELARRSLGESEPTLMPGTMGGQTPFFSPDGAWVGLVQALQFKRMATDGGVAQTISDELFGDLLNGATWGSEGELVVATPWADVWSGGVSQLREIGESSSKLLLSSAEAEVRGFFRPQVLPTGDILVTVEKEDDRFAAIFVRETGSLEILDALGAANYASYSSGLLVFGRGQSIQAVAFDPARQRIEGDPVVLVSDAMESGEFVVSRTGTLVYGSSAPVDIGGELVWVELNGEEAEVVEGLPGVHRPRVSPSGDVVSAQGRLSGITVFETRRAVRQQVLNTGDAIDPIWTPDGETLIVSLNADDDTDLYEMPADGSREPSIILSRSRAQFAHSFSPDGETIAFYELRDGAERDIWTFRRGSEPEPFLVTDANERSPSFSPDGKWIAYCSDVSGQDEIYVRRFPDGDERTIVSSRGGREPVWSRDGTKLFYRRESQFWLADVTLEPELTFSEPRLLFTGRYARVNPQSGSQSYDVSPDGERLLVVKDAFDPTRGLRVVTNVFRDIER